MTGLSQDSGWSPQLSSGSNHPSTLVIGLGNPILGDDGVGWRIAEEVGAQLRAMDESLLAGVPKLDDTIQSKVEVDCLAVGGLALMERLIGYERVILIDAIAAGQHPPGTVTCMPLAELPERAVGHLSSAHDTILQNALRVGETMGADLPDEIIVIGIETDMVYEFSDTLSPAVLNSIPEAVDIVMELIK